MSATLTDRDVYRIDAHNGAGRLVAWAVRDCYGWALMTLQKVVVSTGGACRDRCCAATSEPRVAGRATRTVVRVDAPYGKLSLRESARAALVSLTAGVS